MSLGGVAERFGADISGCSPRAASMLRVALTGSSEATASPLAAPEASARREVVCSMRGSDGATREPSGDKESDGRARP
eukprot:1123709-Alexandrium_andersonii.AAC.1